MSEFLIALGLLTLGAGAAALPLWQVGGVLGFIGGFFRSHLKQSDK